MKRRSDATVRRVAAVLSLASTGAIELGKTVERSTLHLDLGAFDDHCMCIGPTGSGKTTLMAPIISKLGEKKICLFVDDPKGDLNRILVNELALHHQEERVTIFDPSREPFLLSWNPLAQNGWHHAVHGAQVAECFRSAWGQENFEKMPQLLRASVNAAALCILAGASPIDMWQAVVPENSSARKLLLKACTDAFLRREWESIEAMSDNRKLDALLPLYSRLKPVCESPVFQRVFSGPNPICFPKLIRSGGIHLCHLADLSEVNKLIRVWHLRDFVSHLLAAERLPETWIVLDEAEEFFDTDPTLIQYLLDRGRSKGIRCVFIFHTLAQAAKKNPALVASLLTNCRLRFIGGRLYNADLRILCEEVFTDRWHPKIVKDELTSLELDPMETTRTHYSSSVTLTDSESTSHGEFWSETDCESETNGFSESLSLAKSSGESSFSSVATYHGDEGAKGMAGGGSFSSETETSLWGQSFAKTKGKALTNGTTSATTTGFSLGLTTGKTVVPFYEYLKSRIVSSRQFLSFDEYITEWMAKLKRLRTGQFLVQTPDGKVEIFQAPVPRKWPVSKKRITDFFTRIFCKPEYWTDFEPNIKPIETDEGEPI